MDRFLHLIDDKDRKPIRIKKNRSFFIDYLFKSEVKHYHLLRLIINGLIGFALSIVLYQLGWKRLNFADFDSTFEQIIKWMMILGLTFIFTYNEVFRCATMCMIFGAIGKNGQVPLSLVVFASLNDGPISSIVQNFKLTSEAVICNLQVQSEVTTSRVSLLTGPLEDMIENQILKGVEVGKKISRNLKSLIDPFRDDFTGEITDEDINIEKNEKAAQILAERDEQLRLERERKEQKRIDNMTTPTDKRVTQRIAKRCDNIFNKGMEKCHEAMSGLKIKCYLLLRAAAFHLCENLDVMTLCEDAEKKKESSRICEDNIKKMDRSNSFQNQVDTMQNLTLRIEDELKMNMHIKAVQMPRIESTLLLSDIKTKVKGNIEYAKVLMQSLKEVIQAIFIFFVYCLFRDGVGMIGKYRTLIEFNNNFITARFWDIDAEREAEGKESLIKINKTEWREYGLLNVFGFPTKAERKAAQRPFIKWIVTFFLVMIVIAVDRYIAYILDKILPYTVEEIANKAVHKTTIRLIGKGMLADLINDILSINTTRSTEQEFTNEQCQFQPIKTDIIFLLQWIIFPLVFMLVLQVIFAFVIKRLVLFFVLPFMFPRRDRVRMIYLYNKILFNRHKNRQRARARIRFVADRWKMNDHINDGGLFSSTSWFKRHILDRVFKTGECIYCKEQMRPYSFVQCPHCPATYCDLCVDELNGDCYACLAQEGLVNSTRSQLLDASIEDKKSA